MRPAARVRARWASTHAADGDAMTSQPENTRRRRELRGPRHALIGVLALVVVLAIIAAADHRAPVGLAAIIGITQAIAAVLLVGHQLHARMAALGAALLAIAWSVVQIVRLDGVTSLELALLGVGVFEAMLVAGCTPRDAPKLRGPRSAP